LGQRIPAIFLEDIRIKNTPRTERCYVPCPHCNTYHESRIWSKKAAFGNWFGLYCPCCGKIIPCLLSAISFILLAITYPLWGWYKDKLKAIWLQKQPEKYLNLNTRISRNSYKSIKWMLLGLAGGILSFIIMSVQTFFKNGYIHVPEILCMMIAYTLAGLFWGFFMKSYVEKKNK
jgi:MFS family permease